MMSARSMVRRSRGSLDPGEQGPGSVPVRMENQYFALDMESPAAHEMLEQGVCMFYA
jgi:type VI secretion system protein ImpJ